MKKVLLYMMSALYTLAGTWHFVHPEFYIKIMPHFIPVSCWSFLVALSGLCEMAFALLLIPATTRRIGAWLIILLLIAVFPANIQMLLDYWHTSNPKLWETIVRLPLQAVLIWWAYTYTKPVEPIKII